MRRTHLRKHGNILKRMLIHVAGCNLGLLMRELFGVGTPRSLQGRSASFILVVVTLLMRILARLGVLNAPITRPRWNLSVNSARISETCWRWSACLGRPSTTGC